MSERNNVRTNYFLFHSRFTFLTFVGDKAKKENEKILESESEDSQDFSDHLTNKGHNDMDEAYNDQPMNKSALSVVGTSKFLANY